MPSIAGAGRPSSTANMPITAAISRRASIAKLGARSVADRPNPLASLLGKRTPPVKTTPKAVERVIPGLDASA
jgi:hypothetical protein